MDVKIDLKKTYDRINWEFAVNCLREVKILREFNLIDSGVYIFSLYAIIVEW